ncbi:MAG: Gfo/Idh/MocA family oxidoreductase [Candidatus Hydrogenedentes bacterium]|nr:Gfo/Idh/MocA family oxidoreductase [Candidatus Hydrogenedentota bacterium]
MKTTRRTFLKRAGTSAGLLIATGWSPFSYAANSKVRLGMIGVGSQNRIHIEMGLASLAHTFEVAALADCLKPSLAAGVKTLFPTSQPQGTQPPARQDAMTAFGEDHCYLDHRAMLEKEGDGIDAVVIATPTSLHQQMVLDCLDAGKHVFVEKTMGHTYDGCREIVRKVHSTGKVLQVGHQRRYNPEYIHALEGYRDDRLGRVTSIEGKWHRYGDWRRPIPMTQDAQGKTQVYKQDGIGDLQKLVNWRVYSEYSMGLIGELCAHHVDCVNWLLGTPPTRVWATGSVDYWRDDRTTFDNVTVVYEYELNRRQTGFIVSSPMSHLNPLDARELVRPYKCRFTWSGSLQADNVDELVSVQGDRASFALHELAIDGSGVGCIYDEAARYKTINNETGRATTRRTPPEPAWTGKPRYGPSYTRIDPDPVPFRNELDQGLYNKSAELRQFEAFAKCIQDGTKPLANEMCGLMASIAVIAAHESSMQGKTIEIDPALYQFGFETPNAFEVGTVA